jgi:mono/diheme cytochrome c family protein
MDKTITRCCLALFFVLGVSAPLAAQGFSGEHDYNFYCATCHGEDGKGNGPKAADLEREMPVWGVWFKLEAAEELGGAEGDEGTVQRRIDNLLDYIETLQP